MTPTSFNPQQLKKNFKLLKDQSLTYLDNASTTPKPQSVIAALNYYYEQTTANVHRGIYPIAAEATVLFEESRNKVANFINAKPEEIIFTSGATSSINMIARILEPTLKKGDEIVLTILEHHSNLVPWQELAKRTGATLKFIPLKTEPKDNFTSLDYQKAKSIITPKTKIVAFTAISNVTGEQLDIPFITSLARKVNAITVIDATQAAIHGIINTKDWNCDFCSFSGHKMFGPTGIGVLYGKSVHLQRLEPINFGGEMIGKVTTNSSTWNALPYKFEAGTPPIAEAIALKAAIEFIESINLKEAHNHIYNLSTYLKEELKKRNCTLLTPNQQTTIISFTTKHIHPHDLAEIIGQQGICIRAGHHCCMPLHQVLQIPASARVSLSYYNTIEDIKKFLAEFDKAIKKMNK